MEETTGLFLSVLGCWKASYEKIPAWALYLLCFPQKVDGMQATRLEHIYIYETPQLGAYREVEEQCTQPLRLWVAGSWRISRQTAPVCYYTLRSGLSPTLMDQQVLGCILLAHIRLEEAPIVKKSPKCGVHPLFLLKKMPDRCHWPPGGEARSAPKVCEMLSGSHSFHVLVWMTSVLFSLNRVC